MKWPWYWFNLVEQTASQSESMLQAHAAAAIHRAACQTILAAFQEYAPETTLRSAARDDKVDLIKVAIDDRGDGRFGSPTGRARFPEL